MILERFCYSEMGTFGRIKGPNIDFYTIERPWSSNKPFVSCIPEGVYSCRWVDSPSKGRTIEIQRVPNRDHILFHVANTIDDLEGCVGLGSKLGALGGKWAVLNSRPAINNFKAALLRTEEFSLDIRSYHPEYP